MEIVVCMKYLHYVFIFTSLLQYTFAQDCPPNLATLQNTVVNEGDRTSFPRVANGDPGQWQVAPSNDPTVHDITDASGNMDPVYATTYAVSSSQLTILTATTSQQGTMPAATAGLYMLTYQNAGCITGAGLVVIKSGPVCVCDTSNPTSVKLTCSVEFANYIQQQINPIVTWKDGSGTVIKQVEPNRTSLSTSNPGLQNSTDSLSVFNNDSTTYECQLTFTAPKASTDEMPSFIARNAPTFKASCYLSNCLVTTVTTTTKATTTATRSTTSTTKLTTTTSAQSTTTAKKTTTSSSQSPTTTTKSTTSTSKSPTTTTKPTTSTPQSPTTTTKSTTSTSKSPTTTTKATTSTYKSPTTTTKPTTSTSQSPTTTTKSTTSTSKSPTTTTKPTTSTPQSPTTTTKSTTSTYKSPTTTTKPTTSTSQSPTTTTKSTTSTPQSPTTTTKSTTSTSKSPTTTTKSTTSTPQSPTTTTKSTTSTSKSPTTTTKPTTSTPQSPTTTTKSTTSISKSPTTTTKPTTSTPQSPTTTTKSTTSTPQSPTTTTKPSTSTPQSPTTTTKSTTGTTKSTTTTTKPTTSTPLSPTTTTKSTTSTSKSPTTTTKPTTNTAQYPTTTTKSSGTSGTSGTTTSGTSGRSATTTSETSATRGATTSGTSAASGTTTSSTSATNGTTTSGTSATSRTTSGTSGTSRITTASGTSATSGTTTRGTSATSGTTTSGTIATSGTTTSGTSATSGTTTSGTSATSGTVSAISATTVPSTDTTVTTMASTTSVVYNCTGANLTNTVVYEGTTNVSFPRLTNGQPAQWQVISASNFYNQAVNVTYYNDSVIYNTTYAVSPSQLTIFNSTVAPQGTMPMATAGMYIVRYQNPTCVYAANLIVIRAGPYCSCNANNPNDVQLSCGVNFSEANPQPNSPVFTWKNSTSVIKTTQPVPSQISTTMKRSTNQLSISNTDLTTYECQLTFSVTPKSPFNYMATAAPNFTASCNISLSDCLAATTVTPTVANPSTGVPFNCTGQNLTNTVVYENTTNATFPSLANGQAVRWQVLSASDFFNNFKTISYPNGTVNPQYANTYTVTPSQLGIINATLTARPPTMPYATAGLYRLDYLNPNCTYGANLIVIRSGPDCTCDGSDPNNVQLICSVDFAGASAQPNYPVFTWTDGTTTVKTEQPVPSQTSSSMKRATSTYIVDANDPSTYTCQLTFSAAAQTPNNFVTSTAPTFMKSCDVYSCAANGGAPQNPPGSAALDDNADSSQALAIVLSLTFACIFNSVVVFGFWFFCCCDPRAGSTDVKRRRRRILQMLCYEKND